MDKINKKKYFSHTLCLCSLLVKLFEDTNFIKSFKENGGLKSMLMAFQGKSLKEIKEKEIYDKIYKDEEIKGQIRKQLENKENIF